MDPEQETGERVGRELHLGDMEGVECMAGPEVHDFLAIRTRQLRMEPSEANDRRAAAYRPWLECLAQTDPFPDERGLASAHRPSPACRAMHHLSDLELHTVETAKLVELTPTRVDEAVVYLPTLAKKLQDGEHYPELHARLQRALDLIQMERG